MLNGKQAVIFDLDGTLLDTMGIWTKVDQRLVAQLNGPCLSDFEIVHFRETTLAKHALSDNPYEDLCAAWGLLCNSPLSGREIHALRYQISRQLLKNEVRARAGIRSLIQYLKSRSITLAIATCTKRSNVELYANDNPFIRQSIDFQRDFSFILTRDDIAHTKPHPEIYQLALDRLNLPAQACLVIEDSLSGVQAAHAAGIDTIAIYEKYSASAEIQIKNLASQYFLDFKQLLTEISS